MLLETPFSGSRLCIVGNINRDVKIAAIAPGEHLFADGETSTDFVRETIGGGGANSALAAATLGAQVTFMGKVGADSWGTRLEQLLVRNRIRPYLSRDARHPTGTSVNLVFNSGHRHFVSHLASSRSFNFEDLDTDGLTGSQHLLRADIWFSESMLFGGNHRLLSLARQNGVATSIDINWDPEWGHAPAAIIRKRKDAVRNVLPLTDLVHGNVRELTQFAECDDLHTALQRITHWGARAVVIHQGRQGSGFWMKGEHYQQPSVPVSNPVNTTGSGDVLSVCMMLLHHRVDMSVDEKLRFANAIVSEYMRGERVLLPQVE